MPRNIITALDIGTSTVQTVVAERKKGEDGLRILGIGNVSSSGLRRGADRAGRPMPCSRWGLPGPRGRPRGGELLPRLFTLTP